MLNLQPVTLAKHANLYALMLRIYPPAYQQLWVNQDCNWYINSQYNKDNLKEELQLAHSNYYFIQFNNSTIGILRLVHQPIKKTTKLHRLYLDQDYQGQGLGKKVMTLAITIAKQKLSKTIWLEAMDTQTQALQFYKKMGFIITEAYALDFDLIHPNLRGMYKMTKQL
ncbi:GNAT family N-acetyltransferase [Olleya sp. ITB9]|uniref:GNAT family N-acetyltransferase n=1 Tax=Olleya sp. ITB9 TaxID=1715648 RepID=UPI0006CF8B27|nr:GNAT family N-acetyltransferase [Olleya sp. ITB9]